MVYDDSQSVDCVLLADDSHHTELHQAMSLNSNKSNRSSVKWAVRNTFSNSTFRRYRPPLRRNGVNSSSVRSQHEHSPSSYSFPLFRHFYLMRNSFKHKRQQYLINKTLTSNSLLSDIFHAAPRIKIRHIITAILFTITSAFILVFMIFLDFAYLNDSIANSYDNISVKSQNGSLCSRYPKICVMKGLLVVVFISITSLLCYCILTLYIRARRHSRLLERKTDELEKEKCLTQKLLHQILPPCVAIDLINGRKAPAEYFDSVTVYFSDIVGFTSIASMCSPNETCDMLNQLYSIFDSLIENFDVYKVETIGDAYMVVSGAPTKNGDKHPDEIVNMSLALLRGKQQVCVPRTFAELKLRVGIHTGPVCAAVIGSKMPRYCMFGDTVNVANRMESTGLPERIHISDDTYQKLTNREQFIFEDRGEINLKGKGLMRTYFLISRKPNTTGTRSRTNTGTNYEV